MENSQQLSSSSLYSRQAQFVDSASQSICVVFFFQRKNPKMQLFV